MFFINLSNHPSALWSAEQLEAAGGEVHDCAHPNIPPGIDEDMLSEFTVSWFRHSLIPLLKVGLDRQELITVHLMGETGFGTLVFLLLRENFGGQIKVVHSTTHRDMVVNPDGTKTSKFRFCRFRQTGFGF